MPLDFENAAATLADLFTEVQPLLLENTPPPIAHDLIPHFETLFRTDIKSHREALLGITIVRLQDRNLNLRLPYVNQGPTAFNGRDLDEQVINPFLQEHRIPSSRGPYLAMFRRDFRFDVSRRPGQRNKVVFDAFLELIAALENMTGEEEIRAFTKFLLYKFGKLREAADVTLSRLQRISLEQYDRLITLLLMTRSGGRLPVIVVVAALRTISDFFGADWVIDYQGINVADAQTGAGGDITVREGDRVVFAAEVTERPLDRIRVITTFNTKIALQGIEDYLFFVRPETLAEEARQQAQQYFAQGHEVNFVEIKNWVSMSLATMGRRGRDLFNSHLLALINEPSIPRAIKVAWNDYITAITTRA